MRSRSSARPIAKASRRWRDCIPVAESPGGAGRDRRHPHPRRLRAIADPELRAGAARASAASRQAAGPDRRPDPAPRSALKTDAAVRRAARRARSLCDMTNAAILRRPFRYPSVRRCPLPHRDCAFAGRARRRALRRLRRGGADRRRSARSPSIRPTNGRCSRRSLPPDEYRFVELVERGRPDWLASACRAGVRCDVLAHLRPFRRRHRVLLRSARRSANLCRSTRWSASRAATRARAFFRS